MIELTLSLALIAQEPRYNARCLIELAELTDEVEFARTEEGRALLRAKAESVDSILDQMAFTSDEFWIASQAWEREQRDLFDNGLITDEEWADVRAEITAQRTEIAKNLLTDPAPACRFSENVGYLPVFARARAWQANPVVEP